MPTIDKELRQEYARINDITIEKLLTSIFVFHECGENLGHPHIELHSDGSGTVIASRTGNEIFGFENLKELAQEADKLIKKYNIKTVE